MNGEEKFQQAKNFLNSKNYKECVECLEKAINHQNVFAMNMLGILYRNGEGLERNFKKAIDLFEASKRIEPNKSAIYNLACMYKNGEGVKQNYKIAIQLFEEAIELKDSDSMNTLGNMYHIGEGVEKDIKKAIDLYEKAVLLGDSNVMHHLGNIYQNGEGVDQNYNRAVELYENSIEHGNMNSMFTLGCMYENGEGVKKDIKKAIELYEKAIKINESGSLNNLGFIYQNGKGVERNYEKALEHFSKAVLLGNRDAMNNLAYMYHKGQGVEPNYKKSLELYEQSTLLGNRIAMLNLASMYQNGEEVEKNYEIAEKLYRRVINQKQDSQSLLNIASSIFLQRNYQIAYILFEETKEIQNISNYFLGLFYEKGWYVKKERFKSFHYYQKFNRSATQKDLMILLRFFKENDVEDYPHFRFIYYKLRLISKDSKTKIAYRNRLKEHQSFFKETFINEGKSEEEILKIFDEIDRENLIKMVDNSKVDLESKFIPFEELNIEFKTKLGRGSSSTVYKGYYKNNPVALKEFGFHKDWDDTFFAEAQLLLKMDHPHIIKCYGWSENEKDKYLVFDLMDTDLTKPKEKISRDGWLRILLKVAEGMDFLHKCGILHRDLKSSNILLNDEEPKIGDFGSSHSKSDFSIITKKSSVSSQSTLGTMNYAAPEVLEKKQFSEKSDVFSYGMIVYFLFEEKEPDYQDINQREFLNEFQKGLRPKIENLEKYENKDIKLLVQMCWDQEPKNRPSFESIIEKIEDVLDNNEDALKYMKI